MAIGIIDRKYQFEIERFCPRGVSFEEGNEVDFVVMRDDPHSGWKVTSLKQVQEARLEVRRGQILMKQALVVAVDLGEIEVQIGVSGNHGGQINIPLGPLSGHDIKWMRGDWVTLSLEASNPSRVIAIQPMSQKIVVGHVMQHGKLLLIQNKVLYDPNFCKDQEIVFPVGVIVYCVAIQCTHDIEGLRVRWRAIEVKLANRINMNPTTGSDFQLNQIETSSKDARQHGTEKILSDQGRRLIPGSQIIRPAFFSNVKMKPNQVPQELYKIVQNMDETELIKRHPEAQRKLEFKAYVKKFRICLWLEEIENQVRLRDFDVKKARLVKFNGSKSPFQYKFTCHGILDFTPRVNVNDAVTVFDEDDSEGANFGGYVTQSLDDEVVCSFGEAFDSNYSGFPLTVQFNLSRTRFKRCYFAVESAVKCLGKGFLFPDQVVVREPRIVTFESEHKCMPDQNAKEFHKTRTDSLEPVAKTSVHNLSDRRIQSYHRKFVSDTASNPSTKLAKFDWFNEELNEEQRNAVRRVLRGEARPVPYIIFGPPGTGKTVTLVEAVMQINKIDTNSRILVCAPSNAAADVVAEYLVRSNQYFPGDFLRLNGYNRGQVPPLLEPFCVNGDDIQNVAMHRLIVSTCMTAGQFFTLGLEQGHFTHVFVDEAGQCTEPETMVPTILLATNKGGQLILAGDPKQLGPVLLSSPAEFCGLKISLLERLMNLPVYQRNTSPAGEESYNPVLLTKLVKNYRTHATLLKLPSELFYNDELVACASHQNSYVLCHDPKVKDVLVTPGVPLVFHGVIGKCSQEYGSFSVFNIPEAMQIAKYVSTLVMDCGVRVKDIGIITPYRKQVEKIRECLIHILPADAEQPKVASVEEFQGRERQIVLISTVRSSKEIKDDQKSYAESFSFLFDSKRFNVMITRAKSLMIVVGDPRVLVCSDKWKQLVQYAVQCKAYTGCSLPRSLIETFSE